MSIESSGTSNGPKTSAASGSPAGKIKSKSSDVVGTPAAMGFLALLASFEPESGAGLSVADASESVDVVDTQVLTGPVLSGLLIADMPTVLPQDVSSELALLLSQVGGGSVSRTDVADGLVQSLALQVSTLSAATVDKSSVISGEKLLGVTGAAPAAKRAVGTEQMEIFATSTSLPADSKAGGAGRSFDSLLDLSAQILPVVSSKSRGGELQAGVNLAESRAMSQTLMANAANGESVVAGALLTSSMGESLIRPAEKSDLKSLAPSAVSGMDSSWGYQSLLEGRRVEAPPEAANLSPEMSVADTVSYWVTQGVQNAELTLDGFGGAPVEVRISLNGDDAHIDFRTDQPEVREVLEGAVAHLKDLLASEGLALSGVSVGASGQDSSGAGAQDRRNRTGVRQANIAISETPTIVPSRQGNPSVGRALDIFV